MKRKRHDIMLYVQCICGFICLYPTSKCYSVLSTHVFETYRFRISTGTRTMLIKIFHSISRGIFWNNSSITSRQIPSKTIPFLVSLTGPPFDAVQCTVYIYWYGSVVKLATKVVHHFTFVMLLVTGGLNMLRGRAIQHQHGDDY